MVLGDADVLAASMDAVPSGRRVPGGEPHPASPVPLSPLPAHWATPGDFAALYQYLWHRDFPLDNVAIAARRADWTIHIGLVVRQIADLMGLVPRFEHGSRKDAILRSSIGDEIAVEWEWGGVWGNELDKLKGHKVWSKDGTPNGERALKFAVLITYTHTENVEKVYKHVKERWTGAPWPLLLLLIRLDKSKKYRMGKEFHDLTASLFDTNGLRKELRTSPAFPWNVPGTRWCE